MSTNLWIAATDLSDISVAATKQAAYLANATGGRLRLLHVHLQDIVREEFATGEVTMREQRGICGELEKLKETLNDSYPELEIDVDVVSDKPIDGILDEAERLDAKHIVLGTHGRRGFAHLLMGSIAEEVVRRSKIPVTVVKSVDV